MRGIEIMLMGLYSAVQNGTHYANEKPSAVDGEDNSGEPEVSAVDWYTPDPENPMPTEIKVTAWQNMPYSGLRKNKKGEYEGIGYAFELLRLIQSNLHFNYTIVPPKTPVLGDETKGVMKQLYNNEVDIAVSFLPVISRLRDICRFSSTIDEAQVTFMMKRLRESAVGSGLLAPFNDTVWVCILIALIVTGPVIYVLVYLRTRIPGNDDGEGFSLITCIWFVYGALLKQGSTITPVTGSTRVLFATWWIFITILTSFYTANLTAFLTLSEFTLPFNSIKDIVKKHQHWTTFKDHTLDNTMNMTYNDELLLLKEALAKHEGRYITSPNDNNKTANFDFVTKVVTGNDRPLFIGDKYFIEDLIFRDYRKSALRRVDESKRCTLVAMPRNLYVNNRAFAYPLNSSIADRIDKQLRIIVETGIVDHLKKMDLPSVKYCPLNLKSTERQLRNTDLKLTYYCVVTGFTLSVMVFVGELVYRITQLEKGQRCGNCCASICGRSKVKSSELPFFNRDTRPNFLKEYANPMINSPYDGKTTQKHVINGRDYWVITEQDGDQRLVPIRSPSALLFHP